MLRGSKESDRLQWSCCLLLSVIIQWVAGRMEFCNGQPVQATARRHVNPSVSEEQMHAKNLPVAKRNMTYTSYVKSFKMLRWVIKRQLRRVRFLVERIEWCKIRSQGRQTFMFLPANRGIVTQSPQVEEFATQYPRSTRVAWYRKLLVETKSRYSFARLKH